MPAVRIFGRDHRPAVKVGNQPGLGGDVVGYRRGVGRGDDATATQRIAAYRGGGTGSGAGGSPAVGISEESTAGGVDTR
ncbi:penicillin-binding dacB1 domain protein [Mycobacterium xenopi 4042]|uniref:Penicillin-binding dacB1 domain protein n=1 Tax=Mycobacterium xenopi 4042 TaxID=1299334 RepID=X7YK02_MYCXE|nr:penicillin-binding dacB1 domain protein [Mycobacterium xenopi 4042]